MDSIERISWTVWSGTSGQYQRNTQAGQDELIQWREVLNLAPKLGVALIPEFRDKRKQTIRQNSRPIWHGKSSLLADMKLTNAARWVFQMFAQLDSFPSKYVLLNSNKISPNDWKDEFKVPGSIGVNHLVNFVWPIINP